ncbi:MAG: ABC transporter ATP-binding protein [Actinobacteria bacterium]|nr:ABC transporter ATP-binding protein [Actinomycetota bacterium]
MLRYFRSERWNIAGLSVLGLVVAQVEALALVLLVPLAQSIAESKEQVSRKVGPMSFTGGISSLFALALGFMVLALIGNVVSSWWSARLVTSWEEKRRAQALRAYMDADYPTQRAERAGTLQSVSAYIQAGGRSLSSLVSALQAGLSVAVFLVVALLLDVRAALALLAVGAVLSLGLRPLSNRVKPLSREMARLQRQFGVELTETESLTRELRVFGAWPDRYAKLNVSIQRLARLKLRVSFIGSVVGPAYQYLGIILVLAALFSARSFALIDIGVLGATALLLLRGVSYGQRLQTARHTIIDSMQMVLRLEEIEGVFVAHPEHSGGIDLPPVEVIACDGVGYSYGGDAPALADVSFEVARGQIVGVVGPSGSGKSTLSQLLLRLRTPLSGVITVNGIDADQYSLASWYRRLTLVPQDPILFHGTVRENISLFDEAMPFASIVDAAKAAGLHDVIESLPAGYDTQIGQSTRDLSGGQIQRIGIARSLARGADVLVLDEPSSALDVHSEAIVQDTLRSLSGKKLVFIIAHRLSTLSICDRLLVLREGRLESDGSLTDVMETSDYFRRALDAGTLDIGAPG